jgi:hypothetical protein
MNASLSYLHPFSPSSFSPALEGERRTFSFPSFSSSLGGERGLFSFSFVSVEGGRRRVEVVVAEGRCRRRV